MDLYRRVEKIIRHKWVNLPNFKTFPNNLTGSTVLQFQRLFLNWYWHSSIAMCAPYRTLSITSTFLRQIFCCLLTNPAKLLQDSGTSIAAILFILARALKRKDKSQCSNKYELTQKAWSALSTQCVACHSVLGVVQAFCVSSYLVIVMLSSPWK